MGLEIYIKPGVGKRLRAISDEDAEKGVQAGTHVRVGKMVMEQIQGEKVDPVEVATAADPEQPVKKTKAKAKKAKATAKE